MIVFHFQILRRMDNRGQKIFGPAEARETNISSFVYQSIRVSLLGKRQSFHHYELFAAHEQNWSVGRRVQRAARVFEIGGLGTKGKRSGLC